MELKKKDCLMEATQQDRQSSIHELKNHMIVKEIQETVQQRDQ